MNGMAVTATTMFAENADEAIFGTIEGLISTDTPKPAEHDIRETLKAGFADVRVTRIS